MSYSFLPMQPPFRANTALEPCRILKIVSGTPWRVGYATAVTDIPIGLSAEWSQQFPSSANSTTHAVASGDPVTVVGFGQIGHVRVNASNALVGGKPFIASSNGLAAPVPTTGVAGWAAGFALEDAPVNSKGMAWFYPQKLGDSLGMLGTTGIKILAHAGSNGAGAVTLTGAAVGDRLLMAVGSATSGGTLLAVVNDGTIFEATITVVDQIQQVSASNLSGNTYVFVLIPAAVSAY